MKWRYSNGVIAFAVTLTGCGELNSVEKDASFGAIDSCEGTLKKGLLSPTGYRRLSARFEFRDPLDFEQYKQFVGIGCETDISYPGECLNKQGVMSVGAMDKLKEQSIRHPSFRQRIRARDLAVREWFAIQNQRLTPSQRRTGFVSLEYDAVNAYNVAIRHKTGCIFGPIDSKGKFDPGDIYLMAEITN